MIAAYYVDLCMPTYTMYRVYAGIMGQYIGIMRHLYKINQNKTYAPLEVKGAQGRIIGGIVKGKLYL